MKRRWQENRMKEGKDTPKTNIRMGANAQVALEKFTSYVEVEARILDVCRRSSYRLDAKLVKKNIDENTIGIFVIPGSTYTRYYESVEEISKILDGYVANNGSDIPIHVDAASGGFVALWLLLTLKSGGLKISYPRIGTQMRSLRVILEKLPIFAQARYWSTWVLCRKQTLANSWLR
jgi:hypothetical protein